MMIEGGLTKAREKKAASRVKLQLNNPAFWIRFREVNTVYREVLSALKAFIWSRVEGESLRMVRRRTDMREIRALRSPPTNEKVPSKCSEPRRSETMSKTELLATHHAGGDPRR